MSLGNSLAGQELVGKLQSRLLNPPKKNTMEFHRWVERHCMLNGEPFRYLGHEFLKEIYQDTHPYQCYEKASQIGASVKAISEASFHCSNTFRNGAIYYFPTDADVSEFSKTKVRPFLIDNPGLHGDTNDASISLKRVGKSFLYLRGLKSTMKAKTVSADMVIFDEVDEIPRRAKKSALQRISHSPFQWVRELSIPSIPGHGIDESFEKSDQKLWMIKCSKCNQWRNLEEDFPQCLVRRADGEVRRICVKCGKELDINAGQWVAKYPSRENIRGYRISRLFTAWNDPSEILEDFQTTQHMDVFMNEVIGVPHVLAENQLRQEQVLALCGTEEAVTAGWIGEVAVGIDQGLDLHTTVWGSIPGGGARLVALGIFKTTAELKRFLSQFRIMCLVIDGLPETRLADEVCSWYKGKAFKNYYNDNHKTPVRWDEAKATVSSDRNYSLDRTFGMFRQERVVLPRRSSMLEEFAKHFERLKRKKEEDEETGEKWYVYVNTGADHFAHASNYGMLAFNRYEERNVEGACYPNLSAKNCVRHIQMKDLKTVFPNLTTALAIVPHERLPWVFVWAAVDDESTYLFFREDEFVPMSAKSCYQKIVAAQALDPNPPKEAYIPERFARYQIGERESTFIDKLEEAGFDLFPVDAPEDLAVMRIRTSLNPRKEFQGDPGAMFTEAVPGCVDAIRQHRGGEKPSTDYDRRLLMYHEAMAMILLVGLQTRAGRRRELRSMN